MRSCFAACCAMAIGALASPALADVSLTEQQVLLRQQRLQFQPVTAAALEGAASLTDATGLEWFINGEVTYATSSSAAGAASDAVFVGAVTATTAAGGSQFAVLADAFDGYNALRVSVDGGAATFYNQAGASTLECNGRQVAAPAVSFGGVQVSRKIYVPATDGFARWLNVVTNPGASARSVTLDIVSNLGSEAGTRIGSTSSGDAVADTSDDWVTSYEDFVQGASPDPRIAHVLQSPGSAVRLSSIAFTNGDDTPVWSYTFSVPAGGTIIVMNFAAGLGSRADAALKAAQLAALPPGALACMSTTEQQQVANMLPGVVPSGPEPTGPAGITITAPTTAATYTALTPFLALGGLAGPAGLTSVTWSNDRGGSGTVQGLAEWSIPAAQLFAGTNVITVTGTYSGGLTLSDTVTVTLGPLSYQLSEGATGDFFSTDLLIVNPNDTSVDANVTFLKDGGTSVSLPVQTLVAKSRTTIALDQVPGIENLGAVSSVVSSPSGAPLVVERSMFWDGSSYGSHGAAAADGPRTRFLFGEGSQGFFDTFVLLANANITDATASVQFQPEGGSPIIRTYTVSANTRLNVYAGSIPELVGTSFSIVVDSDLPIIAERAMYFGTPLFNGGHDSVGAPVAATQWYFAEGASGNYFDTYVLLGNASSRSANVTIEYKLITGGTIPVTHTVPPFGRLTINTENDHPLLADSAFAIAITSDELITAERSMYWAGTFASWFEAHNAFGVNEPGTKWGLAEGRVGTARGFETYILIGNTTGTESNVEVTFLRVGGGTIVKNYTVEPNSRFNLFVNGMVPELANEEFGAIVRVVSGSPVVVERSLYSTANGVPFAAGTATPAVRLP